MLFAKTRYPRLLRRCLQYPIDRSLPNPLLQGEGTLTSFSQRSREKMGSFSSSPHRGGVWVNARLGLIGIDAMY
ncbi:MAG: hypothetical protein D6728_19555 [Cyanobacteria bacterium J055]|nr:MAG: hypothetical protein D6728_19555 [Cyanobacteria bacterium J055]